MESPDRLGDAVEQLCAQNLFSEWQTRLSDALQNDTQAENQIQQIRKEIAAQIGHLPSQETTILQEEVVTRLVSLASLQASQPAGPGPLKAQRSSEELETLVTTRYPYPIAISYIRLCGSDPGAGAFGSLLDTFESLIHFLAIVVMSSYLRGELHNNNHNRRLLEKCYKGKWGIGDYMEILRETVKLYKNQTQLLPYSRLFEYLFNNNGAFTQSHITLNCLVNGRNIDWGHKTGRTDRFFAKILPQYQERVETELDRCDWLQECSLWRPREIDEGGRIIRASKLDGTNLVNSRRSTDNIVLTEEDRRRITVDQDLLLINRQKQTYLPLLPFALFNVQSGGEGPFFLDDLEWTEQASRLKIARYTAYHPDLERHERKLGDPVSMRLEEYARKLKATGQTKGAAPAREKVRSAPDYNLPEVSREQQFHLATFVGRGSVLAKLYEWCDESEDGRYYLLVGPPGQGKSALLAHFARLKQQEKAACIFHMVRSHREPTRFLQYLIWQAGQFAGEMLEEASYRASLDDLRNILVRLLEVACRKYGRAFLVLDALDELDPVADRLRFLPEHLPTGVRAILSCQQDFGLLNTLQTRVHSLTQYELNPLAQEDLHDFLGRTLSADLLRELQDKVDYAALFRHTDGNPLFLRRALTRIVDDVQRAHTQGTPVPVFDIAKFPNTLDTLFADVYDRMTGKNDGYLTREDRKLRSALVQLLALAREPLSCDDLRGLLGAWNIRVSLEQTRDTALSMSKYLVCYDNARFLLFHRAVVDYLRNHILGDDGISEVCKVYCTWLSTPTQRHSLYRLRHFVDYVCPSNEEPVLSITSSIHSGSSVLMSENRMPVTKAMSLEPTVEVLTDFEYIREKIEAEMVYDLIRNYQSALAAFRNSGKDLPNALTLWARFVDSEAHFLSAYPHLFLQQARNQPVDSLISHTAEAYLRANLESRSDTPYFQWINRPERPVRTPLVRIMQGHTGSILCVAVTYDGNRALSGSDDTTLKIWDLKTGQCLQTLEGHTGSVQCIAVTRDGKRALSGSDDTTLKIWDLETGQCLQTLHEHTDVVRCLAMTRDGRWAISGSLDKTLKIWNLVTGECVWTLTEHKRSISCVIITPDDKRALSGSSDRTLKIWDIATGRRIKTIYTGTGYVKCVAVMPDGKIAITGSSDETLNVWDLTTKEVKSTFLGKCNCITVIQDEERVITGSEDRMLNVWDLQSRRCVQTLEGHADWVRGVAVTQDNRWVVSGSDDKSIRVWDLDISQDKQVVQGHQDLVLCGTATRDGQWGISGGKNNILIVWSLKTGEFVHTLQGHSGSVLCIDVTLDGCQAVSGGMDGVVKLWDLQTGEAVGTLKGHNASVFCVVVTQDGHWAISGSEDKTLKVWDLANGRCAHILQGHKHTVRCVAVTRDGRWAVSGSEDESLKIWHIDTSECTHTLDAHTESVQYVVITADDKFFVSGSDDRTLRVWDLTTGECRHTLQGHRGAISCLAVTDDGKWAISGSKDSTLKVWDLTTGNCRHTLQGHSGAISCLAVTDDGTWAISGSEDSKLKLWHIETGRCVATFPTVDAIEALSVVPGGSLFCVNRSGAVFILRLINS